MGKLLTREIFLKRAHEVHGDKYDYTNTVYINNRHKIDICCPIHGVFTQWANIHLQGKGCPLCAKEQNYKHVYGIGINDYRGVVRHKGGLHKVLCYMGKYACKMLRQKLFKKRACLCRL